MFRLIRLPLLVLPVIMTVLLLGTSALGTNMQTGWTFNYITPAAGEVGVIIWQADFERGLSVPERSMDGVVAVTHLSPDRRFAIINDFDADLTIYDLHNGNRHSLHIPARLRPELRDIRWSPSSRQLTYTSDTTYIATIRETENGLLFDTETYGSRGTRAWGGVWWSPDGTRIAYLRDGGDTGPDVYVADAVANAAVEADSGFANHRAVSDDALGTTERIPTWSVDGQQLAFARLEDMRMTLYVVGISGEDSPRKLTGGINRLRAVSWSPDGEQIAFMGAPEGRVDDIYIVGVNGGFSAPLADRVGVLNSIHIHWTPDGEYIIFGGVDQESGLPHVYQLNVNTRALRQWTSALQPGLLID